MFEGPEYDDMSEEEREACEEIWQDVYAEGFVPACWGGCNSSGAEKAEPAGAKTAEAKPGVEDDFPDDIPF